MPNQPINPKSIVKPPPVRYNDIHGPMFGPPGPATAAQILAATQAAAATRARSNESAPPPPQSPAPNPAAGLAAAHASAAAAHMPKAGAKPPPAAGSGGGAAGFAAGKPTVPFANPKPMAAPSPINHGGAAASAAVAAPVYKPPVKFLIQSSKGVNARIICFDEEIIALATGRMGNCVSVVVLWGRTVNNGFQHGHGQHGAGGSEALDYDKLFGGRSSADTLAIFIMNAENQVTEPAKILNQLKKVMNPLPQLAWFTSTYAWVDRHGRATHNPYELEKLDVRNRFDLGFMS